MLYKKLIQIYVLAQFITTGVTAQIEQNTFIKNAKEYDKDNKQIVGVFIKKNIKDYKNYASQELEKNRNNIQNGNLQPGDIAPNAKILEIEYMDEFNMGAALVRKGSATALISANGNFIIPFNTYEISATSGQFGNGFYSARNISTGKNYVINSSGKIIYTASDLYSSPGFTLLSDCFELKDYKNKTFTYIDTSGKKYTLTSQLSDIQNGIGYTYIDNKGYLYKNLADKFISTETFDEAFPFSDSMALVGKRNEYGEIRYGYINTKGELVIPFRYSIRPSKFYHGYALVKPKDKTEFAFAFINKKGDIVIKKTQQDYNKSGEPSLFISDEISVAGRFILDNSGDYIVQKDFLSKYGVVANNVTVVYGTKSGLYIEQEYKKIIWYSGKEEKLRFPGMGFINTEKNTSIAPVFMKYLDRNLFFDPVAKLSAARFYVGKDNNQSDIWREGYINEDGIFVIVKGKGDKW